MSGSPCSKVMGWGCTSYQTIDALIKWPSRVTVMVLGFSIPSNYVAATGGQLLVGQGEEEVRWE